MNNYFITIEVASELSEEEINKRLIYNNSMFGKDISTMGIPAITKQDKPQEDSHKAVMTEWKKALKVHIKSLKDSI